MKKTMLKKWLAVMAISSLALSGCATTKEVISKLPGKSHDTPLEQVLKLHPEIRNDLITVEVRQYFNNAESPTVAEVKVTETGLLDDSVSAKRSIYRFKRIDEQWERVSKQEEHKCARGKNTANFQTAPCP